MSETRSPRVVAIDACDVTVLFAARAELNGGLRRFDFVDETQGEDGLWVENWTDRDAALTWQVTVPRAGRYLVAIRYSCATGTGGSGYEIAAGVSRVAGTVRRTSGWMPEFAAWTSFVRDELEGTLELSQGVGSIILRATETKGGQGEVMRPYTIELIPIFARANIAAAAQRARIARAETAWFRDAVYGVMFHWDTTTQPRHGRQLPFPAAVQEFDVGALADTVAETGAGYVIFTAVHGVHWFPAPIRAIEGVMAGRTCARDLIGDLADALGERGIRLLLYYCNGGSEAAWAETSGYHSADRTRYYDHFCRIFTEIGERYGERIAGYWFDFCPFNAAHRFERLFAAAKAGNPSRIVAWNSWLIRQPSEFQEYLAGEAAGNLLLPEAAAFGDLQPHLLIVADEEDWVHDRPDSAISPPLFTTDRLVDWIKACRQRDIVATINMGIYQDGSVSPETLAQMAAVRRAIRG